MIDDHQTQVIVVVGLPEFSGNSYVVKTVTRDQLISSNLVPLLRRFDSCRSQGVDAQSDRRTPRHSILHEFHLLAVVRKQKRTRPFETLFSLHFLICFYLEVCADTSVRPNDAYYISAGLIPETEMNQRSGDRLFLDHQTRTDFYFSANAERVDALIAGCLGGTWTHDLPVIVFGSAIDCLERLTFLRESKQVETPITVYIRDIKYTLRFYWR